MIPVLARVWAAGWAASRGTPPPAEKPWGLYIEVGLPGHAGRHVVPHAAEAAVRAAAASATVPDTWLKVPGDPDTVGSWLPVGWSVDKEDTGHLMAAVLHVTGPEAPSGYTVSVTESGGVTRVDVAGPAGEPAARGQLAVVGDAAVFDRVGTEEAHRRRGLGTLVTRTLADRAVADGASFGVLGATDDGRALYETLGWRAYAPLVACVYRP
ncbi:GNAT family N-acetyltransferase [Streptomyces sp. AV19]|uniref:GNAT family N-acetyltransferase n=1 Tax=Streptomyces sp. AV19 TaxID=2793068 RepID=UPI0018FE4958|nr:GNAT family N-acetyltransferase [Streptomyces sp. AV19]MBH1937926.1 GNAT family N-acetyltransferase [Streptomyces sp. AV19]MDG4536564.1 GNAT family N-acetyltransferase [Streptomyces sp. AV19]